MGEDSERGLGCAYVISDSTFEGAGRVPNCLCCFWRDGEREEKRERGVPLKGRNEPFQRQDEGLGLKRPEDGERRRTRKSPPQREEEERKKASEDGDCFAGDMIILGSSVFKEDAALDLRD